MTLPARVTHRRGRPARRPAERSSAVAADDQDRTHRPPGRRRPRDHRGGRLRLAQVGAADGRQRRGDGRIRRKPGVTYPVLVPNMKGFEAALAAGAEEVAVFGAASEAFSQKNINCSIAESLAALPPRGRRGRGSATSACAATSPACSAAPTKARSRRRRVADVAAMLDDMGCYEISLGDTIGVGTPGKTRR